MRSLLTAALFLVMAAGTADAGWRNTSWGMTIPEVEAIYKVIQPKPGPTSTDRVRQSVVPETLAGLPYSVNFLFYGEKDTLHIVNLVANAPIDKANDPGSEQFYGSVASLIRGLDAKYGQSFQPDRERERQFWVTPDTVIELSYGDIFNEHHVRLSYTARAVPGATATIDPNSL